MVMRAPSSRGKKQRQRPVGKDRPMTSQEIKSEVQRAVRRIGGSQAVRVDADPATGEIVGRFVPAVERKTGQTVSDLEIGVKRARESMSAWVDEASKVLRAEGFQVTADPKRGTVFVKQPKSARVRFTASRFLREKGFAR